MSCFLELYATLFALLLELCTGSFSHQTRGWGTPIYSLGGGVLLGSWSPTLYSGFSRRAGDRRFSPCTKAYHAGCKFWIHFIFGTTLNVSTIETKRFLLSARKCSENAGYVVFRGSMPPDPPRCSNFSPYFNFISSYYATLGRTLFTSINFANFLMLYQSTLSIFCYNNFLGLVIPLNGTLGILDHFSMITVFTRV